MAIASRSDPGSSQQRCHVRDPRQAYLYVADGANNQVHVLGRDSGVEVSTFGRNGRMAGQFHWVHNIAIDSRGNIYAAEVDTGKRLQRFTPAP